MHFQKAKRKQTMPFQKATKKHNFSKRKTQLLKKHKKKHIFSKSKRKQTNHTGDWNGLSSLESLSSLELPEGSVDISELRSESLDKQWSVLNAFD